MPVMNGFESSRAIRNHVKEKKGVSALGGESASFAYGSGTGLCVYCDPDDFSQLVVTLQLVEMSSWKRWCSELRDATNCAS